MGNAQLAVLSVDKNSILASELIQVGRKNVDIERTSKRVRGRVGLW
jgi:hypothetical protein